jgi:hypothetical protein
MVIDARRGLELRQLCLVDSDARVALPAQIVVDIPHWAHAEQKTIQWHPSHLPRLMRFRDALAVCTTYAFSCRADSGLACRTDNLALDDGLEKIRNFSAQLEGRLTARHRR